MFYVCQIRDNILGQMDECNSIEKALSLAEKIIEENGVEITQEVKDDLKRDCYYLDAEWSVCIGIIG